ncbi:MAG: DUF1552 domain-containing protein [Mariniblastus sp.]|jgi:hypothetical protein|nr:DUF1552 domain-containing protein [Mariniblastus sp.]MDG2180894.1 DUF1552 domain-containing protein [Mariniblastus sp.]
MRHKRVHFNFRQQLDRRSVLRGAGVAMTLPFLGAMTPAYASDEQALPPKRFVAMTLGLGLHAANLNPVEAGKNYSASRYLEAIDDLRDQFTVISGTSHPGVGGGHRAEACILTANPMGSSGRAKNSISIDQYLAKFLGGETRFPSLVLSSSGNDSPSYTENGAMVPAVSSPSAVFDQLFANGTQAEREKQAVLVREGRSIMDLVEEDAKRLQKELGRSDRDRLDQFFSSVRNLEKRMAASESWAEKLKPTVKADRPIDIQNSRDFIGQQNLMSDVVRLALETDSTRFIVYHLGGSSGVVPIPGVQQGYHGLSHHGLDEEKLEQLAIVESAIIASWGGFLRGLQRTGDGEGALLDHTSVLLTSNLGNASNHSNKNMPVMLAGGGFKHGQHLAFDQRRNYPLPNLFVSLMQQMGIEKSQFASGTGTMTGLNS